MRITFAYWGNYTVAFQTLLEKLGFKVIPPEKTNLRAIEDGAKFSPELFCFPFKVNIGNYLSALKRGADTILMWENARGICRLRYYWLIQKKILREAGFKVRVVNLNERNFFSRIKKINKESLIPFWKILFSSLFFLKEIGFIDELEKKACYLRPREINSGETDIVLAKILEKLKEVKSFKDLSKLRKKARRQFSQIRIIKNKKILKIGLVGEIYTVTDPVISFELEKKLGQAGVEAHREMSLSYFLKGIFPWRARLIQRKTKSYLKSAVGGHAQDTVAEMLDYAKKGFDGVIQLLPWACFVKDTNITVEGYIQKPIQDIKVGDKVLTHKGRFKKVTQTFCRNYHGKILKIDCGGKLLTVLVTPEHPVLLAKTLIKNHKKQIQKFDFIPIIGAEKGDFIAIPIPKEVKNREYFKWSKKYNRKPKWEDIKKFPYSPELLRLLGYWLAEGYIFYDKNRSNPFQKYKRGIVFSFSNSERAYINDVTNIIGKNFRTRIGKYYRINKPNTMELSIGNRNLGDIVFSLCGEHCDGKKLSEGLMDLEPNLQREILKGFFRGDGNFKDEYGDTTYRGVTTSWNLASQLFWLLIRNRIKASLMEQHIKDRKVSWMLKIANVEGIKRLEDELIEVTDRKNNVRFRELKDYFLVPIRKIEVINFKGKVYNLEVEEDHSYVANFLIWHNCMPETTVRPILQKISQEKKIPFISFSIDEQTGEAGLLTRLEAFLDLIKARHN